MVTASRSRPTVLQRAHRQLLQQLDTVLSALQQHSLSDETVHEVRKALKRSRAILRLLRASIGDTTYRRLNSMLRDAARPLTPIRDTRVLIETVDELFRRRDKSATNGYFRAVRATLQAERRHSRDKLTATTIQMLATHLKKVRHGVATLRAARWDRGEVTAGYRHAYKMARNAFNRAHRAPSDEHLHEWRKQVKYYFNQLELLQPLTLKRTDKAIQRARKLADHLGNDHNLALAYQKIELYPPRSPDSVEAKAAAKAKKRLKEWRYQLQRKSYRLGKALFADRPSRVAKRFEKHLPSNDLV